MEDVDGTFLRNILEEHNDGTCCWTVHCFLRYGGVCWWNWLVDDVGGTHWCMMLVNTLVDLVGGQCCWNMLVKNVGEACWGPCRWKISVFHNHDFRFCT